jgi:hypothetical protein
MRCMPPLQSATKTFHRGIGRFGEAVVSRTGTGAGVGEGVELPLDLVLSLVPDSAAAAVATTKAQKSI